MRRGLRLAIVAGMVLLGFWAWRGWFPPDEVVIRKVVERAVASVSWESGTGNLSRLAAASRLTELCAPDVEVLLEARGERSQRIQGREELRQSILAVQIRADWLRVTTDEVEVAVNEAGDVATVLLASTVRGEGLSEPILQDYKLVLRKLEGDWLIARVEPVRGFGM